jgi:hypothetical protein
VLAPNSRAASRAFRTPEETKMNFTNLLGLTTPNEEMVRL